jgi:hypothetical protein
MDYEEFVAHEEFDVLLDGTVLSIDEAVEQGIGKELWESAPYKRLRQLVMKYAKSSKIQTVMQDYPGLSLDAILSLVYYTSDVRRFHGKKSDNIFALVNEALISRNVDVIARWDPFVYYLYEAKKHLPKYSGMIG